MLTGYIDEITPTSVHGWAADTEDLDAAVEVAIYLDGRRVAQVSCDGFRADLRDTGRFGTGQHGLHYVFTPPLSPTATERVTVRFARSGAIVPKGEVVLARWQPLTPILITAPGRSGTTLLMSRLARSPQVVVGEMHPFEVRQIAYWSTVVATLSGPADFDRATHPDRLEGDGLRVGANPFSHPSYTELFRDKELEAEYFGRYVPAQLRDLARGVILEYYFRIRDDRQKPGAVFFAEKNNNLDQRAREFARALFPDLKEIVLVRDPRDLLCSQISYFRRAWGEVADEVSGAINEVMSLRRNDADCVIFVRYEDLIRDREKAATWLAGQIGFDPGPMIGCAEERAAFAVHGTSRSPEASIGRWRSQLSGEQQSWCASNMGWFLSEFEYNH